MMKSALLFLSESRAAKRVLTGTPVTRSMARRFVPGESVDQLMGAIRESNRNGLKVTANYLGESVHSEEAATTAANVYLDVMHRIAREGLDAGISMKFTQLGQDIGDDFLAKNLQPLLDKAREEDLFLRFDMESSAYTQRTLDAFEHLWNQEIRNIGVVLQSYLHRTEADIIRMNELGARVRLCKGAYAEGADVAHQSREAVDGSFVSLMRRLLTEGNYPGIATHDDSMVRATVEFAEARGISKDRFEFQMLYGVRRDLQQELAGKGYNVRVYIPFGESWYPYLMRRLAERPANVLFLTGSVVRESPLGFLWPGGRKATAASGKAPTNGSTPVNGDEAPTNGSESGSGPGQASGS